MSNTYTYHIPENMPQGAYWYHSHLHTLTSAQIYTGLAGLLAIGRTDGNLPLVTENRIPIRNMLLQYNFVFDRDGGLAQLNNVNWPQYVSTIMPPQGDELANGTYRPLLAPVNFGQSETGEKYFTVWYEGPLSIRNNRGLFQFIPSNLQRFTAHGGQSDQDVPDDPVAPRLPARRAVHGQRPVPAGHQQQGGPDRDLGARERQRLRLHERPAYRDRDRAPSADRDRRPGRQSLSCRSLSRHRRRHPAPHSAGEPVRDRRDDTRRRRAGARDAATRRRRQDDHRAGRALHQQRHRQSAGRARQPERPAVRRQLCRRLLRLPDTGAGEGRALARAGRDDRLRRGAAARCLYLVRRALRRDSRRQAGNRDLRRLPQRPREHVRPEGVRLRLRWRRLPQHAADPAAARTRSRSGRSSTQQRRAPDPRPRQRLPGDRLLRSDDRAADRPEPDGAWTMPTFPRRPCRSTRA